MVNLKLNKYKNELTFSLKIKILSSVPRKKKEEEEEELP